MHNSNAFWSVMNTRNMWNMSISGLVNVSVVIAIGNLQQYDKFQSMELHKRQLGIRDSDM